MKEWDFTQQKVLDNHARNTGVGGDIVVVGKCQGVCQGAVAVEDSMCIGTAGGRAGKFLQRDGQDLGVFQEDRKYPSEWSIKPRLPWMQWNCLCRVNVS